MIAYAASQKSKNAIGVCFGEALYVPRNFRAKMKHRSERRDKDSVQSAFWMSLAQSYVNNDFAFLPTFQKSSFIVHDSIASIYSAIIQFLFATRTALNYTCCCPAITGGP
jgi:hypothetical protein